MAGNVSNNYIKLEKGKIYGIPIHNGILRIDVSQDTLYPGLDIEYIDDKEPVEGALATRPRILIEAPVDEETGKSEGLRALVWADVSSEDYSDSIDFEDYIETGKKNKKKHKPSKESFMALRPDTALQSNDSHKAKYYDIYVNLPKNQGYSLFVSSNGVDWDEDDAVQYAIDNHLFTYDGDEDYIAYVEEITEEEYREATGK